MLKTRNLLVRLAAVAAVGAGAVVVNAAPAMAAACISRSPALPPAGSITNRSSVGIGVIHLLDGNCTHAGYDTILPAGRNTRTYSSIGWNEVGGAWIGSGYRAVVSKGTYSAIYYGPGAIIEPWAYGGDWTIVASPV